MTSTKATAAATARPWYGLDDSAFVKGTESIFVNARGQRLVAKGWVPPAAEDPAAGPARGAAAAVAAAVAATAGLAPVFGLPPAAPAEGGLGAMLLRPRPPTPPYCCCCCWG